MRMGRKEEGEVSRKPGTYNSRPEGEPPHIFQIHHQIGEKRSGEERRETKVEGTGVSAPDPPACLQGRPHRPLR